VSIQGSVRLFVQFLVAVLVLCLAFFSGLLGGSLAPLLRLDELAAIATIPLTLLCYLMILGPLALIAVITSDVSRESEPSAWREDLGRGLVWSVPGVIVGGGLVFGVPDRLSTTLPLVALSAAVVAFVFAGDAVNGRDFDTALWSAGGTTFLLVLPAVLFPAFELAGLLLAAVVGIASTLAVQGRLRTGLPFDRRVSVSLAVVFALVAGGAMAYDLSGPRPTASLDHESTVNLSETTVRTYSYSDVGERRATISVGTLTVHNEFDFARTTDLPSSDACLYGEDGVELETTFALPSVADGDDWIRSEDAVRLPGESRHRYPLFVLFEDRVSRVPAEITELGTVPVRRAESCPETTDGPALVLVPDDERGRR
jgi:hypothetical protein